MKKAFTLAEIMIVLSVIAVLAAVLLPASRNLVPDDNVAKFKKVHNTFYAAIRELVASDKYNFEGDLGRRPDESLIDGTHTGDSKYFCQSLADILNPKNVNCSDVDALHWGAPLCAGGGSCPTGQQVVNQAVWEAAKIRLDTICKDKTETIDAVGAELELEDGVVMYQTDPHVSFGFMSSGIRVLAEPGTTPWMYDENGFDVSYKAFCIDIDGTPEDATKNDCINECPFGYGIRADGRILNGARAEEWLKKSIKSEE